MPIFRLPEDRIVFPDPSLAEAGGLLAVGGDLSVARLLAGYRRGIFPWYAEGEPILWWSPDPRFVLFPDEFHVGRSLRKTLRRGRFSVRFDTAFGAVIRACAEVPRPGQDGTWITPDMIAAYEALHAAGFAHSVEAYCGDELAGGLYGVALGRVFFGESMFARRPDASKVALAVAMDWMRGRGLELVDCQMPTAHLARFGARAIPRIRFLELIARLCDAPGLPTGSWSTAAAGAALAERKRP